MANIRTTFGRMMNPSYPVYIVSKGRWDKCITSKQLNLMGVPHRVVVPEDEFSLYSSSLDQEIVPLPQKYLDDYDTCDSLGDSKSKGPGSARNFCWDHSVSYILNTRIYSCLLMENSSPYRWRGRYNEDTDLSLRVLKAGLCTIQFNAFLQGKVTTQRMRGGNSEVFYDDEGTKPKSKMIEELHQDVAKVVWKFNRWHHHVDYRPFKKNQLIKRNGLVVSQGIFADTSALFNLFFMSNSSCACLVVLKNLL